MPEFSKGGKGAITLRHVLTHTTGLPNVEMGWPDAVWSDSMERIFSASLDQDAVPGRTARYQIGGTWFVLGELLVRATGESVQGALESLVFEPLQLRDVWCSLSEDDWERRKNRLGGLFDRDRTGVLQHTDWHEKPRCCRPSPGAGCRGPVRELGRFYESLLGTAARPTILMPEWLAEMTARQRAGLFDDTFPHVVDFGLGVIVDSNRHGAGTVPYGFGRHCSHRAFGHGGSQCGMAFADPQHELVVAWAANGRPGEPQHQKRNRAINEAIYRDLELTPRQ